MYQSREKIERELLTILDKQAHAVHQEEVEQMRSLAYREICKEEVQGAFASFLKGEGVRYPELRARLEEYAASMANPYDAIAKKIAVRRETIKEFVVDALDQWEANQSK